VAWRTGADEPVEPLRRRKEVEGTESSVPMLVSEGESRYMQMSRRRREERLPRRGRKATWAELVNKGVDEGSSPRDRR
jgi:hypothetical protein